MSSGGRARLKEAAWKRLDASLAFVGELAALLPSCTPSVASTADASAGASICLFAEVGTVLILDRGVAQARA